MTIDSPYSKDNVKKSAKHYLIGRVLAGLSGFLVVILMARGMSIPDYAIYTALSGLASMLCVVAGLGMNRVVSRYIPEALMKRSSKDLSMLIWTLTWVKIFFSFVVLVLLMLSWQKINAFFKFADISVFSWAFCIFVFSDILFQHAASILQSLLMQKQLTQLMAIQWLGRLIGVSIVLLLNVTFDWRVAFWILAAPELTAAFVSVFTIQNKLAKLSVGRQPDVLEGRWPEWEKVIQVAKNNYGFNLLAAPPQGYCMKIIAGMYLPTEYVASYGFFLNLMEKFRQYIPLNFFYNLLEPVMIAGYIKDSNFQSLSNKCQMLYKSNLIIMFLAIIFVAAFGEEFISLLSRDEFSNHSWILLLLAIQFTIGSHIVLLQLILNTIEKSQLLIKASYFGLAAMFLSLILLLNLRPVYLFICPIFYSLTVNTYILFKLKIMNYDYYPQPKMIMKLLVPSLISYCFSIPILNYLGVNENPLLVITAIFVCTTIYIIGLTMFRSITKEEQLILRSMIARK